MCASAALRVCEFQKWHHTSGPRARQHEFMRTNFKSRILRGAARVSRTERGALAQLRTARGLPTRISRTKSIVSSGQTIGSGFGPSLGSTSAEIGQKSLFVWLRLGIGERLCGVAG